MAKFVKLESGIIINIDKIVAINREANFMYTEALVGGMGTFSFSREFEVTDKDIDNILKASEE